MRILVTGAAGFIGSNLVKRCLNDGLSVTGVDDLSNGHEEFLPKQFKSLTPGSQATPGRWFNADFADQRVLKEIQNDMFDVVIHLAAIPRVSYSIEHPIETNDVNVNKTLQLIEACKGHIERFVFASSSSVYGGADKLPTNEDVPKNPKSPYALEKSVIEEWLKLYADQWRFDSVCLRFFNVYGENATGSSPYSTALAAWLTAIKNGVPMRSDGDGTQSRDMCHVDNVVDACIKATQKLRYRACDRPWRCYNVACGEATTNKSILNYLLKRYQNSTYVSTPWRSGDVMHTLADISKIKSELYYNPIVNVWPDGVERTCNWFDANWNWVKDLKVKI